MNIRRVLILGAFALVGSSSTALLAQAPPRVDQREEQRRNQRQQEDVTALIQLVDAVSPAGAPGSSTDQQQGDVAIAWNSNHFIKGQDGSTYVPFTLTVDRSKLSSPNAVVYVRAVSTSPAAAAPAAAPAPAPANENNNRNRDRNAAPPPPRVTYPWEKVYFTQIPADGRIQRPLLLPGGEYDVFIAVKDQGTGDKNQMPKNGLLRKRIVVPDYKAPELVTSSIMVGNIEPLTSPLNPAQQQENPYVFGTLKIVPVADLKLPKNGELSLIFWIYGAQLDPLTRKPNVTIEYNFHQKTGDTEKYFNKTAPQDLNAQTLPPEFDLAAGHQLPGSQAVPMMSFPAGDYRLEIKITDKTSGKSITQNVNFTVNAA